MTQEDISKYLATRNTHETSKKTTGFHLEKACSHFWPSMKIAHFNKQTTEHEAKSMPGNVYGKFLAFVVSLLEHFKTLVESKKTKNRHKMFNIFSCLLSIYLTMITGARISEAVAMALSRETTKTQRITVM